AAVSTDDGLTWTPLGKVNDGTWQPTIVLPDPHRSGVLYGGSPDALWVSSDSGATWGRAAAAPTTLLSIDSSTGVVYAVLGGQLVMSNDLFATTVKLGPAGLNSAAAMAAGGGRIFVGVYQ